MFGKSQTVGFQYLKKPKIQNSLCLEKPKFRILMFGKGKIWDSNVWTKQKCRIPKFGIAKV